MRAICIALLLLISCALSAQERQTFSGIMPAGSSFQLQWPAVYEGSESGCGWNVITAGCAMTVPNVEDSISIAQLIDLPLPVRNTEYAYVPALIGPAAVAVPPTISRRTQWRTDKSVILSTVYEAIWLSADGVTTAGFSRNAREVGSPWAYGKHPTAGRTAGVMAAEFVGVEAGSYLLHKLRAPKWIYLAPMFASGTCHATGAIHNARIGQ